MSKMATNYIVLLVCTAICIVTVSGECLNGWTRFDDSCYRVFEDKKVWPEAQFACETHDAFLGVIETKHESVNVHALIKELNFGDRDNIWIGLSDIRHEGVFVWEDRKQNATFFDWADGEPNEATPNKAEDCVMLWGNGGHKWADVPCDVLMYYLCERE